MINNFAECKLTDRDLALIASRIFVDYSKLLFLEDLNSSSEYEIGESKDAWSDLYLLYGVISQFIKNEPLV